jgi:NMD protein affecting ribosome stability and mRNA decay
MRGKALIRSTSRKGSRTEKGPMVARKTRKDPGPTVCHDCGSIFANKTWRRDHKVSLDFYDRARFVACPACHQAQQSEGFGRVVLKGSYVTAHEEAIRRRIGNVAERAETTQPQRRLVSITKDRRGLEVVTTSQKLAHRIAHELKKAFHGRTTYAWSDRDGSLHATWERDEEPASPPARHRSRRA